MSQLVLKFSKIKDLWNYPSIAITVVVAAVVAVAVAVAVTKGENIVTCITRVSRSGGIDSKEHSHVTCKLQKNPMSGVGNRDNKESEEEVGERERNSEGERARAS